MGISDSAVSTVNRLNSWTSEEAWCNTPREKGTFVLFKASRTFLSCNLPLVQLVPELLSLEIEWPKLPGC
jgi:hypothetical protein